MPGWMVDECRDAVGDLSETISLLVPPASIEDPPRLADVLENVIVPMPRMPSQTKLTSLKEIWSRTSPLQRFVFHKLLGGSFRVGVSRTLLVRALAEAAGVSQAVMSHRLMGEWQPTAAVFAGLVSGDTQDGDVSQPYPFYLASPLDGEPSALGDRSMWQAEWKWDGIRAQMIRRAGRTALWSRGEELIGDRFSDVTRHFDDLPDGIVLDGELLAWDIAGDQPLPFQDLQRRIGRTSQPRYDELLFVDTPVMFVVFDVLELDGIDLRTLPLKQRRGRLERMLQEQHFSPQHVRASEVIFADSWEQLATLRAESRGRRVEGLMLKHLESAYGSGRERNPGGVEGSGGWWKWKIEPYTIDAVLVAAQPGSGRRASVYTDYTFAVWSGAAPGQGSLVTIAKAYSGLTDNEIDRVDAFVRKNTVSRHGPVRVVKPELVFELACEGIHESHRHGSGVTLRFPRIFRSRADKTPAQADTVASVRKLGGLPPTTGPS